LARPNRLRCRRLIGVWAVLIGFLELVFAHDSAKDRTLLLIAAIASIALGLGMMKWASAGAVVVSAVVGVAAAARGISLIVGGIHERTNLDATAEWARMTPIETRTPRFHQLAATRSARIRALSDARMVCPP
jgi:hypothetical protein